MTQRFFMAPPDISLGRVTLQSGGNVVARWVATPGQPPFAFEGSPGRYTASIEPLGLAPRAFAFDLGGDTPDLIESPEFSALAAGWVTADLAEFPTPPSIESPQPPSPSPTEDLAWTPTETRTPPATRTLSIGLSAAPSLGRTKAWVPYTHGDALVEVQDDVLIVRLAPAPEVVAATPRVRISIALEKARVQRLMAPLFAGGVRIEVRPSPLTTGDLRIRVLPEALESRALFQALQAGGVEEARAVQQSLLPSGEIDRYLDPATTDPWTGMVAALLTLRFPDLFGSKPADWAPHFVRHFPWASDSHVLMARHRLVRAPKSDAGRAAAALAAIKDLATGRRIGATYFTYANQLVGELLASLAAAPALPEKTRKAADQELRRWRNDRPLQANAGGSFSWLKSAPHRPDEAPTPFTDTRGNLNRRYSTVLFRGELDLARLRLTRPAPTAPAPKTLARPPAQERSAPTKPGRRPPPALARKVRHADDPNKGRFGGRARAHGYELTARFGEPTRNWVRVDLIVRAKAEAAPPRESVELYLHDSFHPCRVAARFRGREACLTVNAWGGFTVGAWLPEQGVELECDLAELPDAPRIIRER